MIENNIEEGTKMILAHTRTSSQKIMMVRCDVCMRSGIFFQLNKEEI
jgi:hypothetical protein